VSSSDDPAHACSMLMEKFGLTEAQAEYIHDTPLHRLTRYDKLELEREKEELQAEIAELNAILGSEDRLRRVVSKELAEVAKKYRSEEHTSELQSRENLVCRLLLEKKKKRT